MSADGRSSCSCSGDASSTVKGLSATKDVTNDDARSNDLPSKLASQALTADAKSSNPLRECPAAGEVRLIPRLVPKNWVLRWATWCLDKISERSFGLQDAAVQLVHSYGPCNIMTVIKCVSE